MGSTDPLERRAGARRGGPTRRLGARPDAATTTGPRRIPARSRRWSLWPRHRARRQAFPGRTPVRASGIAGPRNAARGGEPTHSGRNQPQHQSHARAHGAQAANGGHDPRPARNGAGTRSHQSGGSAAGLWLVLLALAAALIAARMLDAAENAAEHPPAGARRELDSTGTLAPDQWRRVGRPARGDGRIRRRRDNVGNGNGGNHAGVAPATPDRSDQRPGAHAAQGGGAGEAGDAFNLGLLLEETGQSRRSAGGVPSRRAGRAWRRRLEPLGAVAGPRRGGRGRWL